MSKQEPGWLPTDKEIGDVLQAIDMEESHDYPCSNGDVIITLDVSPVAKFTAKKIAERLQEKCLEHGEVYIPVANNPDYAQLRWNCPLCKQELLTEIEES